MIPLQLIICSDYQYFLNAESDAVSECFTASTQFERINHNSALIFAPMRGQRKHAHKLQQVAKLGYNMHLRLQGIKTRLFGCVQRMTQQHITSYNFNFSLISVFYLCFTSALCYSAPVHCSFSHFDQIRLLCCF